MSALQESELERMVEDPLWELFAIHKLLISAHTINLTEEANSSHLEETEAFRQPGGDNAAAAHRGVPGIRCRPR
jgi:hypothetical protein